MTLNLQQLCRLMDIDTRPVGVYDAPDPTAFAPLVSLKRCVFDHYTDWQSGKTLDISDGTRKCPGCRYWLRGAQGFPNKETFVKFLFETEGLRECSELMDAWIDATPPYRPAQEHVLIGPVREEMAEYLKTVTFFVNPDQMSVLMHGAVRGRYLFRGIQEPDGAIQGSVSTFSGSVRSDPNSLNGGVGG